MLPIFSSNPMRTTDRRCPDCDVEMGAYICGTASVDVCIRCNGIWFDEREIGQFRAGIENFDLESMDLPENQSPKPSRNSIAACPVCQKVLVSGQYGYNSKVWVERCGKCAGIWLPGNEVRSFVRMVKTSQDIEQNVKALGQEKKKLQNTLEHLELLRDANQKRLTKYQTFTIATHARGSGIILPLHLELEVDGSPLANCFLIATSVLVFSVARDDIHYLAFGLIPADLWKGEVITLLTSPFMHAGVLHLIGNMFFLWVFGPALNQRMGHLRYLALYFCTALAAGLVHAVFHADSMTPAVGASGAIAAVIGAVAVLYPRVAVHTLVFGKIFRLHIWYYVVLFLGMNLYIGYRQAMLGTGNIGWVAHIGGLLSGIVLVHGFRLPRSG